MDPMSDYDRDCRILEIEPGASFEEIKQAHHDQTKVWHPDRFANDVRLQNKAEEKLKQINLAYQRLRGGRAYEHKVLNGSREPPRSEWKTVFFALRRALKKSVIAITKPFGVFIAKTVSVSNKLFQWCHRQARSVAIATAAFFIGLVFGVWLSPHKFKSWGEINNVRQKIIEKVRGVTQVTVSESSLPKAPRMFSQMEPLTGSSLQTPVPASPPSIPAGSNPAIARPSGNVFPWKADVVTTVFWVGQEQVKGKTSPQGESVWDKDWLNNFGGLDDPDPAGRHDYVPISFVPRQNPFYCALPYNDVEQGHFKPEAPIVIPWFKQVHAEPGRSVCKDRWVAIRKGDRICYAQWEDSGPFRTNHFQYVFQNERPSFNGNPGAGLSISPAVRDHLGLAATDFTDWRFVEVNDVPPGPWRDYGENNPFVIARRQPEQGFADQKESVIPAGTTTQAASSREQKVMLPSAAKPEDLTKQKGSVSSGVMEPPQSASPPVESVAWRSAAGPEKDFPEPKRAANQAPAKSSPAHRTPHTNVISASAAKAITTYAPRPPYPQQARSRRIGGSGVCVVSVDASGGVTEVSMARSTGSPLLDKSVLRTVHTWRFKPGTVGKVSVPVDFTLEGDNR